DRGHHAIDIAEHAVALPLAFRLVTENDLVAVFVQVAAALAERVVDRAYVFRFARHEEPARAGAVSVGKFLEPLRRVVLRIDRHGDEEEVAAHLVAELVLHLCQPRRSDWADVRATRINEVDDDGLAFEQIVVEAHGLPVLGDYRQIGEITFPPVMPLRLRRLWDGDCQSRERGDAGQKMPRHFFSSPGKLPKSAGGTLRLEC